MKKIIDSANIAVAVVVMIVSIAIYSCKDNSTNPTSGGTTYDANSINGLITFVDTNRVDTTNGYYDVSAFATWPPTGPASANVKIYPTKQTGGIYTASYKLAGLPNNGNFVVTSSFIKLPYASGSVLGLGSYGCDTSASCLFGPGVQKVTLSNGAGVGDINFRSFVDTTRKIYKF